MVIVVLVVVVVVAVVVVMDSIQSRWRLCGPSKWSISAVKHDIVGAA